jgi:Domain of unknown function (DUF397)
MDVSRAKWRKASRSNSNGGACVEVATWRKASKSSSNGGDCVEVSSHRPNVVAVRDSKDSDGPKLAFSPAGWERFTASVRAGAFDPR